METKKIIPTQSLQHTASWVIVNKQTNKAVMETFNKKILKKVNRKKYSVIPILKYLQSLNNSHFL